MKVFKSIREWQAERTSLSGTIGFVPTMGALHRGHATLLESSRSENDISVLSIYVNPTQFNNPEDLTNYPCTLDADLALARELSVDAVILPRYADMYADGYHYRVDETDFSRTLCGINRPGHFTGVLTVVMKLLNLVRPQRAYFGEKDHQQLTVVKGMVDAFFMPVEIVPVVTVRDADGLALSSRNARLTTEARRLAPLFPSLLAEPDDDASIARKLADEGFTVDYVETRNGRRYGAVVMDCGSHTVRLIDNLPMHEAKGV
ncbi:MAG: pantoate--beta-alanine ligase [Gammaproteobacteria bacterium]|nr:pantoate--beta-alanine ligase [Gammaproteobacteria bacterium]